MAWRLSTPLQIAAKTPHTPITIRYYSLDSFKTPPHESRTLYRGIWAGRRLRQGHISCQNGTAGKSSLHIQCKRGKYGRQQWPCTLPTPKQIRFNALLQSPKQQRKLAGKTGRTQYRHFQIPGQRRPGQPIFPRSLEIPLPRDLVIHSNTSY